MSLNPACHRPFSVFTVRTCWSEKRTWRKSIRFKTDVFENFLYFQIFPWNYPENQRASDDHERAGKAYQKVNRHQDTRQPAHEYFKDKWHGKIRQGKTAKKQGKRRHWRINTHNQRSPGFHAWKGWNPSVRFLSICLLKIRTCSGVYSLFPFSFTTATKKWKTEPLIHHF